MEDYIKYVIRAFNATEDDEPCAGCEYRSCCWFGTSDFIDKILSNRNDSPFMAVGAFIDIFKGELCVSGKDSLIQNLIIAIYMITNSSPLALRMELKGEDE